MDETIRDMTESGDFYEGTPEAWDRYRAAINSGDYATAQSMEEGFDLDFWYAP